ncbi:hypothetical protein STEG23_013488 [Scotinomys teguina]
MSHSLTFSLPVITEEEKDNNVHELDTENTTEGDNVDEIGANEAGLEDLVSALTCVGGCQVPVNQSWVFINFLLFFIPTLVMITVYTKIFFIAKQQAQKIERMSDHTAKASDSYKERVAKRKRKAAKTLGIAVAAFLLSWLPYFIDSIIDAFLGFITPTGKNYGVINSNFCSVSRFLNNKTQRTGHGSEALYIAVTDPLVYPTKFSVSVSGICISISWTLPLVYSSAVFYTGISARGNESLESHKAYFKWGGSKESFIYHEFDVRIIINTALTLLRIYSQ